MEPALTDIVEKKPLAVSDVHAWCAFVLREPPQVHDIYILYSEGLVYRGGW